MPVGITLTLVVTAMLFFCTAKWTGNTHLVFDMPWFYMFGLAAIVGIPGVLFDDPNGAPVNNEESKKKKAFAAEFLAERAKEPDTYTLPSGVLFQVLRKGPTGGKSPKSHDECEVHYCGMLTNGQKFDSSYDRGRPLTFKPSHVIAGWTEALQLMREDDEWKVFIPYQLAYGSQGAPPTIPSYAPLVFEMELLKVRGTGKGGDEASKTLQGLIGKSYDEVNTCAAR